MWPSPAAASSLPAPGLCRVTALSASRFLLGSARKAGGGRGEIGSVEVYEQWLKSDKQPMMDWALD